MSSPNTVALEGYLTRAEVKQTPTGKSVLNGTIAVSKGQGKGSSYFDFEVWNLEDNIASHFVSNAGGEDATRVGIRGRLVQDTWKTDDGSNRSKVKISVQSIFVPRYPERDNDSEGSGGGSRSQSKKSSGESKSKKQTVPDNQNDGGFDGDDPEVPF